MFETNDDILNFLKLHSNEFGGFHMETMLHTINSVEYIINNNIEGDFIEIGVYKGIMIIAILAKLLQLKITTKKIHLYDTFSGMTEPSNKDINPYNVYAKDIMHEIRCYSTLEDVKKNIDMLSYPKENIQFHVGDIRKCNISEIPEKIAFLRLDTDFYDSTLFELENFEPNVLKGGVVTLDDYNWWKGCTDASNDYFKTITYPIQLHTLNPHGAWWIKG